MVGSRDSRHSCIWTSSARLSYAILGGAFSRASLSLSPRLTVLRINLAAIRYPPWHPSRLTSPTRHQQPRPTRMTPKATTHPIILPKHQQKINSPRYQTSTLLRRYPTKMPLPSQTKKRPHHYPKKPHLMMVGNQSGTRRRKASTSTTALPKRHNGRTPESR